MTDKTPSAPRPRRRRSGQSPALRVVDWMIESAPDGDLSVVFVTVVEGSETLPCKNSGQCYVLGQHELRRLLDELGEQWLDNRHESPASNSASLPAEHAPENHATVSEEPARLVLSAYGLLGN